MVISCPKKPTGKEAKVEGSEATCADMNILKPQWRASLVLTIALPLWFDYDKNWTGMEPHFPHLSPGTRGECIYPITRFWWGTGKITDESLLYFWESVSSQRCQELAWWHSTCTPSGQDTETKGSWVLEQPRLYKEILSQEGRMRQRREERERKEQWLQVRKQKQTEE